MSLQNDLDEKHLRAVLNGLVKMQFYNENLEEQITELFAGSTMSPTGDSCSISVIKLTDFT
jgi:hypothetical protein